MLRHGETVFLDDTTIEDVEKALGVTVRIVEQDGADLARALCGN
jgi:NifB/MoaA-like Fe-S oxidoreductase